MAGRLRAHDWATTPLGPVEAWPAVLRAAVGLCLGTGFPAAIYWGPELRLLYNDAWALLFGEPEASALGRPAREVWGDGWDVLAPQLAQVLQTGEGFSACDRLPGAEASGEVTYWNYGLTPIRDEDGAVVGVLHQGNETTGQVATQRALAESEARLRAITNSIDQMIWSTRPDGYHDYYNDRWYDYTGMPPGSTDGEGWNGMFHPDDQAHAWTVWHRSLATGEPYHIEYRLRHRSGQYRWVLGRAQPVRDEGGHIVRWYGTCTDIHELKTAEDALRESDERLRLATTAGEIGTWDYNPETGELRWDARCKALFGLPADAPITYEDAFLAGLHPDDRAMADAAVAAATAPGGDGAFSIEYRTIGLTDGVERWIAANGRAVFLDGHATRFIGTVRDITVRKRAQLALAESESALREESHALEILNRTAARVAAELDLDTLVQTVVDAGVELTGAAFGAFFYNVIDQGGESYMLYALSGVPREAFSSFPMPRNTAIFAPTFGGEGLVRSADITRDPRYGKSAPHHGMPAGHLPVRSYLAAPVVSRSGEVIGGLFFGHGDVGLFGERTERLVAGLAAQAATGIDNARLFQSAQRLNQSLETQVAARTQERDRIWQVSQDLLGVAGVDGVWRSVNPAWTRVLGWEPAEIVGRTSVWLEHPDDREKTRTEIARLAAGQPTPGFENRLRARDGSYRTLSWTAVPVDDAVYCVARDVTSLREQEAALLKAEEQLRQAQKMEAVGQLTGGIAHDFNNLLAGIMGSLDMLQARLTQGRSADADRYVAAAQGAARRAAALTHRLLAFSRRQTLDPRPTDVNRLVAGIEDLLRRTVGPAIAIEVVGAGGLWPVLVDSNQLENALLNLCINARDAMPNGGRVTIETANKWLDERAVPAHDLPPGQYTSLCVTDTGTGMSAEVITRAFEPFFTTKPLGSGTGLGLSMIYGFVRQSGGQVRIYSELGQGTTVCLYLPRHYGEADAADTPAYASAAKHPGDGETVMVIDDEPTVRMLVTDVLEDMGYTAIEAGDGPSGLKVLQSNARIDLLITDVGLPGGMNGRQVADAARVARPDLKVLFITGYAENAVVGDGRLEPGMQVITKPFAMDALASRIKDLLAAP